MKFRKLMHMLIIFGVMTFICQPLFPAFSSCVSAAGNNAASFFDETDTGFLTLSYEAHPDDDWETGDFEFDDDWEGVFTPSGPAENGGWPFSWHLKTALRNHISTDRDLQFRDANKKNEILLRLETTWGAPPYYIYAVSDAYFFPTFLHEDIGNDHPYSPESKVFRNLRVTTRASELVFREMYANWDLSRSRIRVGNQLFLWGTADFMNSTAYFNPSDLRELIFRPQDENRFGVPSASAMLFFDAFTVELVFVPFHVPPALPSTGHFWAVKQIADEYPLVFGEPEALSPDSRNFGFGGRVSATRSGIDFAFSAYHGPDRNQLMVPYATVIEEGQPIALFIQPKSFLVDYVGVDMAFARGDFVFQVEAAFSPNKRGLVRQENRRPQDLTFPYDTRRAGYYSYTLGFNYFIPMHNFIAGHTGESLFTVEWYQAGYDDDEISRPLLTDFLTIRLQDSFFDDRIRMSLTQLLETRNNGAVWWPRLGYDFKNGFEMEIAYIAIHGKGGGDVNRDSLFYYFKNNDFIMVNFRYAFL